MPTDPFSPQFDANYATGQLGPESEFMPPQASKEELNRLLEEKQKLIIRMLNSDIFRQGEMSFADISKVTEVPTRKLKKIYQQMSK